MCHFLYSSPCMYAWNLDWNAHRPNKTQELRGLHPLVMKRGKGKHISKWRFHGKSHISYIYIYILYKYIYYIMKVWDVGL